MFTIPSHGWFMALFCPHYPLVKIQKNMERSTIFLMGKSTISMAMFNSKLLVHHYHHCHYHPIICILGMIIIPLFYHLDIQFLSHWYHFNLPCRPQTPGLSPKDALLQGPLQRQLFGPFVFRLQQRDLLSWVNPTGVVSRANLKQRKLFNMCFYGLNWFKN